MWGCELWDRVVSETSWSTGKTAPRRAQTGGACVPVSRLRSPSRPQRLSVLMARLLMAARWEGDGCGSSAAVGGLLAHPEHPPGSLCAQAQGHCCHYCLGCPLHLSLLHPISYGVHGSTQKLLWLRGGWPPQTHGHLDKLETPLKLPAGRESVIDVERGTCFTQRLLAHAPISFLKQAVAQHGPGQSQASCQSARHSRALKTINSSVFYHQPCIFAFAEEGSASSVVLHTCSRRECHNTAKSKVRILASKLQAVCRACTGDRC